MRNTKQAAQQETNSIDSSNSQIQRLLHQKARERAITLRWNTNNLLLAYVNLIVVIILTLIGVDNTIVALVAVFGLALLWLFSRLQVKKLEDKFYEQEIRNYTESSSGEPSNISNRAEASNLVSTAESLLTHRELDILGYIVKGMTNKEAAYELKISTQTVKNHVAHIFWKLDVNDRTSAVLVAIGRGWIKADYLE